MEVDLPTDLLYIYTVYAERRICKPLHPEAVIVMMKTTHSQPPPADLLHAAPAAATLPQSLWYACHLPWLRTLPEFRRRQCLSALAGLLEDCSSDIRLDESALVCEVRSALRYFGGLGAIHEKLGAAITQRLREWGLPDAFSHAAAPTMTGSLLLARAGGGRAVHRRANLRAALQELPVSVLQPDRKQDRRLRNMGIRQLRDLWRLPVASLMTRFGAAFVDQLDRALGKAPEPLPKYVAPLSFRSSLELPAGTTELDRLLPAAEELLARLCDFLGKHCLAAARLEFSLLHEQRPATGVALELRRPSGSREHFLMLLQTRLGELAPPAPVTALRLVVARFSPWLDRDLQLLRNDKATGAMDAGLDHLLEQLQARLGEGHIRGIEAVADHRPEYASREFDHAEGGKAGSSAAVTTTPRPLRLLEAPQRLACRNGQPLCHGPVSLLSGPERIESGWWSGEDMRRDYYIGAENNGRRLWLYRECNGEQHWYLHGFFA